MKNICDWNNCLEEGSYKAPVEKDNSKKYRMLCLNHIKEFNKNWNYFEGMNDNQIYEFVRSDMTWHKPTQSFSSSDNFFKILWNNALKNENVSLPAGTLEADNIDLTINLDKSFTNIDELKFLPIKKSLSSWRRTKDSLSTNTLQKILDAFKVYYYIEKKNLIISIISVLILSTNKLKNYK